MKKFICLMLVIVLICSFSACESYEPIEPTIPTVVEPTAINFSSELDIIFSDYLDNPVAAKEKYEKNPLCYIVHVKGKIVSISETAIILAYPTNLEGEKYTLINAFYSEEQLEFVKTLKKDDYIRLTGSYINCDETGVLYGGVPTIQMRRCTFEIHDGTIPVN